MSNSSFSKETKLKQLSTVWHENKGNWLLATAVLVSLCAWAVGYFDLIPDFRSVSRLPPSGIVVGGKTLTVNVVGCASDKGQVVAMLYSGENFTEDSIPIRIQNLEILDGEATWQVYNLPYGKYAVYAFHDIDTNDTVDPSSEHQGLSQGTPDPSGELITPSNRFKRAVFEFDGTHDHATVELR